MIGIATHTATRVNLDAVSGAYAKSIEKYIFWRKKVLGM